MSYSILQTHFSAQRYLRRCFLKLTKQSHINHFQNYAPISDEIAKKYADEEGPGPEGLTKYQLYFGEGWRGARWNVAVVHNITSYAIENRGEERFHGDLPSEAIRAIFWGYITQSKDSWKQKRPRVHEEERDRFETVAEAANRASVDTVKRYKSVRKANRKRTVSVCPFYTFLCI